MRYRMIGFFSPLIFLGLFSPGHSWADEVWLRNGDRISGTILKKDDGTVEVKTGYAGILRISWQEIDRLVTEVPVAVLTGDERLTEASVFVSGGKKDELPAGTVSLEEVKYINPPVHITGQGVDWKGRVDVSASITDGNTRTETSRLDGEVIARSKTRRYTLASLLNYATDNDLETESNVSGMFKLDQFVTDKWYLTGNLNLLKDKYKDLHLRTIAGGGGGYQFMESRLLNLAAEAGIDYIREDFISSEDEEYPAGRWAFNYDQYLFAEALQVFHRHKVNVGLKDTEDILISSQTGLRIPVMEHLTANFVVDIDWDNSPGLEKKRTDTTYLFGLGYVF